jgi:hypothetical protein
VVVIHVRQSQDDAGEDDGVEDADEGDAQHDPQRYERDLPRPRDQPANGGKPVTAYVVLQSKIIGNQIF